MNNQLSIKEAREIILNSQRLINVKKNNSSIDTTLSNIEHLGHIQIDAISVVQRAHHHILWARNVKYEPSQLDELIKNKKVFEYWSHAASYMPMSEYKYTLPRKMAIMKNEQTHWYDKDEKLMKSILKRITKEGPLMVKDFEHTSEKTKEWVSKPAKKALECLFIQGDLMISSRVNFHKVYDLTQRVLPKDIDTTVPSVRELITFLISKYLKVNAFGQASQIAYQLKNTKKLVIQTLNEMYENKELIQIKINEQIYYALANMNYLLTKHEDHKGVKILSPFDNLLIQRKRIRELFEFDYLLECYLPQTKRKYGYFSLPILWNGELVARMDCRTNKKEFILDIFNIVLESKLKNIDFFAHKLRKELSLFLEFNHCIDFILHNSVPLKFKSIFLSKLTQ